MKAKKFDHQFDEGVDITASLDFSKARRVLLAHKRVHIDFPTLNPTMKPSSIAGRKLSFEADLEDWVQGMDYCAVPVPAEITEALGTKGPVLVMARVNDSKPFQVSLFPVGGGQHFIRIKSGVRLETNTKTGDRIKVRFSVLDRADVAIPDDLRSALVAEGVADAFKSLPPGKKNFTIRRIAEPVKPETRQKRIQEAVLAAHERRDAETFKLS